MATLPPLDDPRLDTLVALYATAARRLEVALGAMLVQEGPRRFIIFQSVISILEELQQNTDAWSAQFITQFLDEADLSAVATLEASGITVPQFGTSISEGAVRGIALSLTNNLQKANASVRVLAQRIFRATALEREFPTLAAAATREVGIGLAGAEATAAIRGRIANQLRQQFAGDVVSVINRNGRRMTFPLDFYAGMVAQNTKAQAQSFATLERAAQANHDLVRVTPNPSKGGDWCDAYRGRVYSISGGHDVFPPLAGLPNGGPPFHPWCKHGLGIYVPAFNSEEENRERAATDSRFLMQPGKEDPKGVISAFWAAKRAGDLPEPIRFA